MIGAGVVAADAKCAAKRCASIVAEVMIDPQIIAAGAINQPLQVAEQEIDVEAAFVGLVDDDRVVAGEQRIRLRFGQQDTVGHQLDARARGRDLLAEADPVADIDARRRARVPRRSAARRSSPRAGAAGYGRSGRLARCGRATRPAARQSLGSWVVLPEPVSPQTITTRWARIASMIGPRCAETGSESIRARNSAEAVIGTGDSTGRPVGSPAASGVASGRHSGTATADVTARPAPVSGEFTKKL